MSLDQRTFVQLSLMASFLLHFPGGLILSAPVCGPIISLVCFIKFHIILVQYQHVSCCSLTDTHRALSQLGLDVNMMKLKATLWDIPFNIILVTLNSFFLPHLLFLSENFPAKRTSTDTPSGCCCIYTTRCCHRTWKP